MHEYYVQYMNNKYKIFFPPGGLPLGERKNHVFVLDILDVVLVHIVNVMLMHILDVLIRMHILHVLLLLLATTVIASLLWELQRRNNGAQAQVCYIVIAHL